MDRFPFSIKTNTKLRRKIENWIYRFSAPQRQKENERRKVNGWKKTTGLIISILSQNYRLVSPSRPIPYRNPYYLWWRCITIARSQIVAFYASITIKKPAIHGFSPFHRNWLRVEEQACVNPHDTIIGNIETLVGHKHKQTTEQCSVNGRPIKSVHCFEYKATSHGFFWWRRQERKFYSPIWPHWQILEIHNVGTVWNNMVSGARKIRKRLPVLLFRALDNTIPRCRDDSRLYTRGAWTPLTAQCRVRIAAFCPFSCPNGRNRISAVLAMTILLPCQHHLSPHNVLFNHLHMHSLALKMARWALL